MLKICNFSFYSYETTNIISTEQFAVYATLCFNMIVSQHLIGLTPLSKVASPLLSAPNIMETSEQFLIKQDIS